MKSVASPSEGVAEDALVRLRRLLVERLPVAEVEVDRPHPELRPRDLGREPTRDALVGLDAQHHRVRLDRVDRALRQRQERHLLVAERDLGDALAAGACPVRRRTARRPSASCRSRARARGTSRPCCRRRRPPRRGTPGTSTPSIVARVRTARARRAAGGPTGGAGGSSAAASPSRRESRRRRRTPGGSIATSASTCSRWFCTMSRSAPGLLVERAAVLDAELLGHRELTWST